jgi:hypothetical protein
MYKGKFYYLCKTVGRENREKKNRKKELTYFLPTIKQFKLLSNL